MPPKLKPAARPIVTKNQRRFQDALNNADLQGFIEQWTVEANETQVQARSTALHHRQLLMKYLEFVEARHPAYVGNEFDPNKAIDFVHELLIILTTSSRGFRRDEDGERRRITFPSLLHIRWGLLFLAIANSGVDAAIGKQWAKQTYKWCWDLQKRFNLPTGQNKKKYLGPPEARLIIEHTLKDSPNPDNACQRSLATLTFLVIGCRPGSVLRTKYYPECYLLFEDVVIKRLPGKARFLVTITLRWFKGYHDGHRITITFNLFPTEHSADLIYDYGILMVAWGYRRGAFDKRRYPTEDALLNGNDDQLQWDPDFLKKPVFLASTPRGLGLSERAMSDANYTEWLKLTLGSLGLDTQNVSSYSFRRNMATRLSRSIGTDATRLAMGHRPDSHTLEDNYDNSVPLVDFVAHALGRKAKPVSEIFKQESSVLYRRKEEAPTLSIQEAADLDEEFLKNCKEVAHLQECIETEQEDWDMFLQFPERLQDGEELLEYYSRAERTMRNHLKRVRKQHREEQQRIGTEAVRATITRDEVAAALAAVRKPSTLPQELIRRYQGLPDDSDAHDSESEPDDVNSVHTTFNVEMNATVMSSTNDGDQSESLEQQDEARLEYLQALCFQKVARPEHFRCPKCALDITCSDEQQERSWKNTALLQRHLAKGFHNPDHQAVRLIQKHHEVDLEKKEWKCPWCPAEDRKTFKLCVLKDGSVRGRSFGSPTDLITHVHGHLSISDSIFTVDEADIIRDAVAFIFEENDSKGSDSDSSSSDPFEYACNKPTTTSEIAGVYVASRTRFDDDSGRFECSVDDSVLSNMLSFG